MGVSWGGDVEEEEERESSSRAGRGGITLRFEFDNQRASSTSFLMRIARH